MVYESGFTTRRTYTSRPIVTSYSVTYPVVTKVSRVYKTSYPIYSTDVYTRGNRVITSPVRVVTSPIRYITRVVRSPSPSPVRVIRTTRVIRSPEPLTTYSYTTPIYSSYSLPSLTSSAITSTYLTTPYTTPSYVYTPLTRLYTRSVSPVMTRVTRSATTPLRLTTPSYLKRTTLPGYGARALTNYLGTEPYTVFQEEANRIRHKAQSLIRDVHTPVPRYSRSTTPFPSVLGWEPYDKHALDAYVARVTNPIRHVAQEVHRMSMYSEPARKYVGKSHLASVRICGNRSYDIRKPMYDTDRVRTDINLLSWHMRHSKAKEPKSIDNNFNKNNNNNHNDNHNDNNDNQANSIDHLQKDPELDPYRPSRKFSAPRTLDDPEEDEMKEKQRLRQERLMTLKEEAYDEAELEKKKAQRAEEKKRREQKSSEDEEKRKADVLAAKNKMMKEELRKAQEKARKEKEEEEEAERLRKEREEAEKQAAEALRREAEEAEMRAKEEEKKRQAEEEARKRQEEEERARKAEEERKAAEEEAARIAAEEAARKAAEAARLAEEQRVREEELQRLAEIEKQAEEEKEAELARQAAELAEMARQEAELAAQELQTMQQHSENETSEAEKALTNHDEGAAEPVIEEPLSPETETDVVAPPSQEPTIELNLDGGNAVEDEEGEEYSSEEASEND